MDGYVQTALGILVSIALFLFTYRQTIGAKKERAKNANESIRRSILRRMVLEKYSPSAKDISRLIQGKGREFRVSATDLYSEQQVLNTLFTDVFDSDLLPPEQRTEIGGKIEKCIDEIEKEPLSASLAEFREIKSEAMDRTKSVVALALSASVIGTLTSVLVGVFKTSGAGVDVDAQLLLSVLGVLFGSLAVLATITVLRRSREVTSAPSRGSEFLAASQFEAEVAETLQRAGLDFEMNVDISLDNRQFEVDFLVTVKGKKIAIEAKSWGGELPRSLVVRTLHSLTRLLRHPEVAHVILVTRRKAPLVVGADNISVVPLESLVAKVKSVAASA